MSKSLGVCLFSVLSFFMLSTGIVDAGHADPVSVTAVAKGNFIFVEIINNGEQAIMVMLLPLGEGRYGVESRLTEVQNEQDESFSAHRKVLLSESAIWPRYPARYSFLDNASQPLIARSLSFKIGLDSIPKEGRLNLAGYVPYIKMSEISKFDSLEQLQNVIRKNAFEFSIVVKSEGASQP